MTATFAPDGAPSSAPTRPRPLEPPEGEPEETFEPVCPLHDLPVERGVAALVGGEQVALFRTHDDAVFAVQQLDPYCGAHVISRGIVGTRGAVPTVASPMYKQVFDLRSGECLDPVGREPLALRTWPVLVRAGVVHVGRTRVARARAA